MLFTMRRKKSLFFGFLSMVLIIQPSFSDVPEPVAIEESLAAGLKVSNSIAASQQAFVVARQAVAAARAANEFNGNFALSGSNAQSDSKSTSGGFVSSTGLTATLSLSKRIYDSGESKTKFQVAEFELEKARNEYLLAEQNVLFDVISAHLEVLSAQKAFDIKDANERRLFAHTEAAKIRLAAGTSTPTRLAEAEARLARAQSDKILAKSGLQSAVEAYESLTGFGSVKPLSFSLPQGLPENTADAEMKAGQSHPSVIIADLAAKSSGLQFKLLKQSVSPKVDFSLSASRTEKEGRSSDKDEITTKLEFSTPFLVTETTRTSSRSRQASHLKAQLDASERRRVVELEARRAFREYEASVAQIKAVESELRAAKLVAEGTESEVEFGLKTLLDLLDAEHDFSNAELRFVQAQQDLIVNGYNLMRSTGELSVSQFALEITPPALDSISDPPSRYPYIIPLMVK